MDCINVLSRKCGVHIIFTHVQWRTKDFIWAINLTQIRPIHVYLPGWDFVPLAVLSLEVQCMAIWAGINPFVPPWVRPCSREHLQRHDASLDSCMTDSAV